MTPPKAKPSRKGNSSPKDSSYKVSHSKNEKKESKPQEKDPMVRVMEILEEYDKGTPPYQSGVDHWGE